VFDGPDGKETLADVSFTKDEMAKGKVYYNYLDLTPKGRNETGPNHDLTDWVRHHDRYDLDTQKEHALEAATEAAED
jgi:hypothetical protein